MGYSQDQPTTLSQPHSLSSNGSPAPFSPKSHGSLLQSSRRRSPAPLPAPDEPPSLRLSVLSGADSLFLPTRAPGESDRNSCSDSFLSKHSFSEDLNNFPPNSAFISATRPDSPDSGSLNHNEPFSPSLPGTESCDCPVCTRGSELGSDSGPDHNSCTDSLSKHSLSEDPNNSARFILVSHPNSLDSGSLNYNQPSSPEHLDTSDWRPSEAILSSHSTSLGPAENRPASPVTASSVTLVS